MAVANTNVEQEMRQTAERAREASHALRMVTRGAKDEALIEAAKRIREAAPRLKEENAKDLAAGREKGLSGAMLDRLALTDARIEGMAVGLADEP